jgi:hypothetical protein
MSSDREILIKSAWRGALVAALLNALGSPLELLIGARTPGFPSWPSLLSSAAGFLVAGYLIARRRSVGVREAGLAFVLNNAAIQWCLWIGNDHFALAGAHWSPFQANNLGCLAAAFLAPEIWSGAIVIVGFAGSAIVQYLLFPPDIQNRLPLGQPWPTLVYGIFGIVLLGFFMRRRAMEVAVLRSGIEKTALQHLARRSMAIRDLANTPIQTIELTSAILRTRRPDLAPELDRIDRALSRLHDLNALLADLDASDRRSRALESFDARAHLQGPQTPGARQRHSV